MSLLTDPDFLLQSLRLNYIRHVLPNHAAHSSIPGTGPYNLISFDPADPTLASPYVVQSGLADEPSWPELTSGRSSPPLGMVRGRSGDLGNTTPHRRRVGGPGALQYSQTIGKGVAGPGMRVGSRTRSLKNRGALGQLDTTSAEESGAGGGDSGQEDLASNATVGVNRRRSLETSIHHRRMGTAAEQLGNAPIPPPVVIHSPVKTPRESPIGPNHPPHHISPPGVSMSDLHSRLESSLAAGAPRTLQLAQTGSDSPLTPFTPGSIPTPSDDRFGDVEDGEEDFAESPLESPTQARSLVPTSQNMDSISASASVSSPLAFGESIPRSQSPLEGDDEAVLVSSSLISSSRSPSIGTTDDAGTSDLGERMASVASSGVSLFGVSRVNGGTLGRERSDSDSSFAVPMSDKRVEAIAEAAEESDEEVLDQAPPVLIPPNIRIRPGRERRRVNISGRMLVPISEPPHEEESPTSGGPPPTAGTNDSPVRPRSNTDPELLSAPGASQGQSISTEPTRQDSPARVRRKNSAPSLMLASPVTTASDTSGSSPRRGPNPAVAAMSSTLRPPIPHRHNSQPTLVFAPRSSFAATSRPPPPQRSALSALLSNTSDSMSVSNPFSSLYAALVSRSSDALKLSVYFPHSKTPSKPLKLTVKRDVSVEEVIGVGLWMYWEESREPKLDVEEDDDPEHDETTKWNLRIVEDDGEVDEDFPALDRTRALSAFSFDEFAIVKAAPQQVKDNQAKQSTIQRRPSRVFAAPKRNLVPPPAVPVGGGLQPLVPVPAPSSTLAAPVSMAANNASFRPGTTMGVSSALAIPVLLKVRLPPAPGVEAINTTINVPSDMYMSDVLDHICKKRGLESKEWTLVVQHDGKEIVVPLDRNVNSLGEQHNLTLVPRSRYVNPRAPSTRQNTVTNVNPSASIFKRLSEPPQPKYQSTLDLTSAYQRYTVQRKLPMPLGRHPRTIAIDGDYIHFMPSDSKGMLSGGRTSSFHISNVQECKVSRRAPNSFKLLVQKDRLDKRYDFEAESPKAAAEIVAHIRLLMAAFKTEQEARMGR
ncbi:SIN1-domain-containing protein [Meredithblackwellia eburnea MCA 4105]